ncbi:MAG: TrmB family transcriptional regulator [Candidatus Marinimicrobia bacterium]|nr:TrmB family transcriptional regulator [Candidatus Neomarinimicrobiota bacterium]MBT4055455.1 TrmB family transcriptional regulator [Candidatus Neomarinimicrobiota bacterium]MBT6517209.1 TrmB family transcriptional regulator [Candidatus Neomarinimicrobiota bacterium]MBT7119790.1 TrmB family transcriptional regulator [Candidatus Neomarinimicrobiota bacterium]
MSKLIELLQHFGLSANAAKAYLALLKYSPATGYEISSQSGIPRSAIYSILNRLETIGIVNSVGESPKKFIPLAPSSLLEHFDHSHQDRLDDLKETIGKIDIDDDAFDFWHLHGYRNLILKMRENINNAKDKIFLSGWPREIKAIEKDLNAAKKRGIDITLFSFCSLHKQIGKTISYELDEEKLRKIWTPKIILVVDHSSTIMGSARETDESRSIYTKNEAIIEIAANHIILDITLAGQRLGFDPNPIVKRIMKRPDLDLDRLINS